MKEVKSQIIGHFIEVKVKLDVHDYQLDAKQYNSLSGAQICIIRVWCGVQISGVAGFCYIC